MTKLKVVIADDSHFMRLAVRKMLQECAEIEIMAECERADEAAMTVTRLKPDIALLDFEMPGGDGYQMIREIRKSAPATRVLVFSSFIPDMQPGQDLEKDPVVLQMKAAGAHACLPKGRGRNTFDILEQQTDLLTRLRKLAGLDG